MRKPAIGRIEPLAADINGDPRGDLFGHLVEQIIWSEETAVDQLVRTARRSQASRRSA
jgi:hypothetical protein